MRWRELFADLEAQAAAAEAADFAGEVADRSRRELASVRLVDRLRAGIGTEVVLQPAGGEVLRGRPVTVGADWVLLAAGSTGQELLVTLDAVQWLTGVPAAAAAGSHPAVESRLTLSYVLRRVARDRSAVALVLRDRSRLFGTIDAVGADALDLAQHEPGEPRRPPAVAVVRTVPFIAVSVVSPG